MNKQNKKAGILLAILILIISISSVGFAALDTGLGLDKGTVDGLSGYYTWINSIGQSETDLIGAINITLNGTGAQLYGYCVDEQATRGGAGTITSGTSTITNSNIIKAAIVLFFRSNMTQQDAIDLQMVIWHITDGTALSNSNQEAMYQQAYNARNNYRSDSYSWHRIGTSTHINVRNTTKPSIYTINNTIINDVNNPFINGTGNWTRGPISYQAYNQTLDEFFNITHALYNVTEKASQEITNLGVVDPNTFKTGISNTSFNNSKVTTTQEYINGGLYNVTTYYFEEGWEAWWNGTITEVWKNDTETILEWNYTEFYRDFWFGKYTPGKYQGNIIFNMTEWNRTVTYNTSVWNHTYFNIIKGITGHANFYRNWTNVTYTPINVPDVPVNPESPENPDNPEEPDPVDPTPTNPNGGGTDPDNPETGDSDTENSEIPSTDENFAAGGDEGDNLSVTEEPNTPAGVEDPDTENTTFEETSEDIPIPNTALPVTLLILSIFGIGAGYKTVQYRKKR